MVAPQPPFGWNKWIVIHGLSTGRGGPLLIRGPSLPDHLQCRPTHKGFARGLADRSLSPFKPRSHREVERVNLATLGREKAMGADSPEGGEGGLPSGGEGVVFGGNEKVLV